MGEVIIRQDKHKEPDDLDMLTNSKEELIPPGEEDTNGPSLQFSRKGINFSTHSKPRSSQYLNPNHIR